jgi:hypothetical protein
MKLYSASRRRSRAAASGLVSIRASMVAVVVLAHDHQAMAIGVAVVDHVRTTALRGCTLHQNERHCTRSSLPRPH